MPKKIKGIYTPNWEEWLRIPEVKIWEACALSLNIEPHSMSANPDGWMAGPGHGPLFLDESFPDKSVKEQFESRERILIANLSNPFFTRCTWDERSPGNHGVVLKEFALWARRELKWDIPDKLAQIGTRQEPEISEIEDPLFMAAFGETLYNDRRIEWRYWVHQMPMLNVQQASRLMSSLDPDVFEDLDSRPNKNDPRRLCTKARNIERLAIAQGVLKGSPTEWLEWGMEQGFEIHKLFKHEVESLKGSESNSTDVLVKSVQREQAHQQNIVSTLKKLGYEPTRLPRRVPGKPWVKSRVRRELPQIPESAFEKAWDSLRSQKEIDELP